MSKSTVSVLIRQLPGHDSVITASVSSDKAEAHRVQAGLTIQQFHDENWLESELIKRRDEFMDKFPEFRKATWTIEHGIEAI